jgi:sugar lactone lactonase YvrE
MKKTLFCLVAVMLGLEASQPVCQGQEAQPQRAVARPRRLPGVQPDGGILLHNQWSLRPAGRQLELGDFPVNLVLHPNGRWLAVLHAGYGEHEIAIVDLTQPKITSRVNISQTFYGLCFSPDGRRLFASGAEEEVVHAFTFDNGYLSAHQELPIIRKKDTFIPAGLAVDAAGRTLFVAGPWGDAVCVLPLDAPGKRDLIHLEKGSFPYTCLVEPSGRHVFVSLWGKAGVAVLDVAARQVVRTLSTDKHPTEMALTPDGKTLFVACANSTRVSVIDLEHGQPLETLACSLYPQAPAGNTPNSLSLTPDGQMLFVANADANNVAVFNVAQPGQARPLGFIPAGWYPTSVRYNPTDQRLYIASARGNTPRANPHGPNDLLPRNATRREYIAGLYRGTLAILDLPTPEQMVEFSKDAYACSPLRPEQAVVLTPPEGNAIPAKVGNPSPIKHVLYIIKENRTYDQVLGDMKQGNGDPDLVLFGERVTANHHKLAREFVLLDNFYCDGEVSANGHEWSMGAYATDFVEKVWPLVYRPQRRRKLEYPAEGHSEAMARPTNGYIWDRCAEANVSYRSYGEWVSGGKAHSKALEGHFDPKFEGFNLDYPDQKRADRFIEELARFERTNDLPRFIVLRLPNDHTSGTRVGKPTPTAYVADNDLALGRVVEAVSKSKFWKETAIFIVEDDAQNGSDHVDAHRAVALVISPYVRRGQVDSSFYSTSSMLRTMELILGLKPMSQFDAAARPMYQAFGDRADLRPYEHVVPEVNLKETNQATAWGAKLSEQFDLTREDQADDLLFNDVIWRSVKGPQARMPAPVRAAFVFPHPKVEKDDD